MTSSDVRSVLSNFWPALRSMIAKRCCCATSSFCPSAESRAGPALSRTASSLRSFTAQYTTRVFSSDAPVRGRRRSPTFPLAGLEIDDREALLLCDEQLLPVRRKQGGAGAVQDRFLLAVLQVPVHDRALLVRRARPWKTPIHLFPAGRLQIRVVAGLGRQHDQSFLEPREIDVHRLRGGRRLALGGVRRGGVGLEPLLVVPRCQRGRHVGPQRN